MWEDNIRIMRGEVQQEKETQKDLGKDLADNTEKLKLHKQLPYLVANCIEARHAHFCLPVVRCR